MPYCLEKQDNGSYAVLNREYKSVGFNTSDYIKYEEYPVTTKSKVSVPLSRKNYHMQRAKIQTLATYITMGVFLFTQQQT